LDYGCHVRDVFFLYDERLQLMHDQNDPLFPNWDQDDAAVSGRYEQEEPSAVAEEIERGAASLAERFDSVTGERWEREGRRSDGASFTVESFARYLIHDPIHHVHDVRSGYRRLRSS
nr:DinB family protein [Actinomycetota bacterium]